MNPNIRYPSFQEAMEVDWDKGLPLELLSAVAGGQDLLKAMRGVSLTWKAGYEASVKKIKLSRYGPMLPAGGVFALRFPAARSVDLSASRLVRSHLDESLRCLFGAKITHLVMQEFSTLTDECMPLLRQLPLTRLELSGCEKVKMGLKPHILQFKHVRTRRP